MTKQQEKMLDMLVGFHKICEQNSLKYYLIGNQLLFAAQRGNVHGYEVEVAMFHADWERFQELTKDKANIEIESIEDGGRMPGCYFRYVDKNTLLLDLDRYGMYAKPGIAVNIYLIRSERKKTVLLNHLEKGMSDEACGIVSPAAKMLAMARKSKGQEGLASYLSDLEQDVRKKSGNGRTVLKEAYAHVCAYPSSFWNKRTLIMWLGNPFYTVGDYPAYLKKRFGRKWKEAEPDIPKENYRCMFSTALPYRKYLAMLAEKDLFSTEFQRQYKRFFKEYEPYKQMLKDEETGWDKTIFAAGERFRLWKKYMPLKERVKSLMDARRFDEAELIMKDYLSVLEKYLGMGIAFCFDKDYLDMARELYIINGQKEVAESIDRYVLPEDLKPIKISRQGLQE